MASLQQLKQHLLSQQLKVAKDKYEKEINGIQDSYLKMNIETLFEKNLELLNEHKEHLLSFVEFILQKYGNKEEQQFFIDETEIKQELYLSKIKSLKKSSLTFNINSHCDEYEFVITFVENYVYRSLTFYVQFKY